MQKFNSICYILDGKRSFDKGNTTIIVIVLKIYKQIENINDF